MKIIITTTKPRNPLVAPTRFRLAGRHRQQPSLRRQDSERALRRELDAMKKPSP